MAKGSDVGEERFGAPGAIGADQDRMSVAVGVGNLGECGVQDDDVIGGGVGAGVAGAQLGGEELAGVVAEREQGVVAEGVLERRRGMFFLAVADQHVRIHVDHQRVQPGTAGDS